MISDKDLAEYCKTACRNHKQLNHREAKPAFFLLPRDVTTQLQKAGDFIFVYETPEFRIDDNNGDNIMKEKVFAFTIAKLCKVDDFIQQDSACDECEEISMDFISLFRKDNRNYNAQLFGYLPLNNISGFKVGPIFGGYFGKRTEVKYGDSLDLSFNSNKWNS